MKWSRLSQNQCPQCAGELQGADGYEEKVMLECSKDCGFKISEDRMSEIVGKQNARNLEYESERQGFDRFEL